MPFRLSKKSLDKLDGVHPKLVELCIEVIGASDIDFGIVQGVRTKAHQEALYAQGRKALNETNYLRKKAGLGPITAAENDYKVTWTLESNHIPRNGHGMAIDFGVYVDGKYVNGDTPEEQALYYPVAETFKSIAKKMGIKIEAGADWTKPDIGHIELKSV